MSIAYPARPVAARLTGRVSVWLTERSARRAQRRAERELAELPPYLLRDVGLVGQANLREASGGRTFDHSQHACTALASWTW